ncbi:MAG: MFS transporter [Nakamurella sp.]
MSAADLHRADDESTGRAAPAAGVPARRRRIHPAWIVAGVSFIALIGAAGVRSAPGVLMVPLQDEFGWSRGLLSVAVGINLILYGLTAPFAAALMDRFGVRRITCSALVLVALGSGLTIFVSAGWQLVLTWGVLIGLGTGSMALVFAATIANRWFVKRRGLVMGVLTAAGATGQLVFLPLMAWLAEQYGWRSASLVVSVAALAVVPLVLIFVRNYPADLGVRAYGAPDEPTPETAAPEPTTGHLAGGDDGELTQLELARTGAVRRTIQTLFLAARKRTFWALVAGFAICGATTNGLIGTHFVPAAHDHGMPLTTAGGLLALVGIFDVVGTIASGALTDRVNPRILLAIYDAFRGVGLLMLPSLLSDSVHVSMLAFVIVYGLDWVATVPPTAALCREAFGEAGTIVFGWVFAAHQLGAALASVGAGYIRDLTSDYTMAWLGAAGLCAVAALMSLGIRKVPVPMNLGK